MLGRQTRIVLRSTPPRSPRQHIPPRHAKQLWRPQKRMVPVKWNPDHPRSMLRAQKATTRARKNPHHRRTMWAQRGITRARENLRYRRSIRNGTRSTHCADGILITQQLQFHRCPQSVFPPHQERRSSTRLLYGVQQGGD